MKKKFTFCCLSILFSSMSYSQAYYYLFSNNLNGSLSSGSNIILSSNGGTVNDVLSSAQALPFAWNFYGTPVTHFKASDNGYITFDTSSAVSYPSKTTLPNAGGPNSAIYAFWTDFDLQSYYGNDVVSTRIYGSAPNRIFVVYWDVTQKGKSPSGYYFQFATRIYESGNFDVVYMGTSYFTNLSGATGVENNNGTDATSVAGSPNIVFPNHAIGNPATKSVYTFMYGTQPSYDLCGISANTPEQAGVNGTVTITGTTVNYGSQTVTSFDLNYSAAGGPVQTCNITGVNILTNASYNFTHTIPWSPTGAGSYQNIKIWASNINGNADDNPSNDTINTQIFATLGISATKKVLIEEFSTAPCVYCPEGNWVLDTILQGHANAIGVTHHSGYQSDAMTIPQSLTYASGLGASGSPMATFDRFKWPGEMFIADAARAVWSPRTIERLNQPAPVDIDLTTTWNSSSRQLDVTVDLNFVDYTIPGDKRLTVFVVEDSVTGTGSGYEQANGYNNSPGTPFYGLGNPIIGYVYNHTIREVLTPTWGTTGIISSTIVPGGSTITQNYTYMVPASYREKKMDVIAFVNYYDMTTGRREVLNAEEKVDITSTTGINEISYNNISHFELFPNPSHGVTAVTFETKEQEKLRIDVYNSIGEKVQSIADGSISYLPGKHTLYFTTAGFFPGVYYIKINSGSSAAAKVLVVTN